jgi:trimeric autotransporter adhesin
MQHFLPASKKYHDSCKQWIAVCVLSLSALLSACSDGSAIGAPPTLDIPVSPSQLVATPSVKAVSLSWTASPGASYYVVFEDLDGAAGPLPAREVARISETRIVQAISQLLSAQLRLAYAVKACNASGCSAATMPVSIDLSQTVGYIKASNTQAGDLFGSAAAISADAKTVAVGAQGYSGSQGAVYVFARDATGWHQQAFITAPFGEALDYFGKVLSLSLSADGNTLVVGADGQDSDHKGTFALHPADNNLAPESGAVYVYKRTGVAWALESFIKASNAQASDLFGFSVALSADGNTLAVGAWGESRGGVGVGADLNASSDAYLSGAAYVFTRSAGIWSQQTYIKASARGANGIDHQWFGISVALSGDGNTLAIGSLGDRSNSASDPANSSLDQAGSVHTYTRSGSTWTQQAYLKSHAPQNNDTFGVSVSLSFDGRTLAVGMHGDDSNHTGTFAVSPTDNDLLNNSGAAYVYALSGSAWQLQAYLKSSHPDAIDRFGRRVVLSGDGNTLAISAHRESGKDLLFAGDPSNNSALDSGAVYLFQNTGGSWLQQRYIKASNTEAGDSFGIALALSFDGQYLLVGADKEDSSVTGLAGNMLDNSALQSGAIYLY